MHVVQMKLIYPAIIALVLLSGAASAQVSVDRDRFDVVLHPGEVEEKVLTLTNTGGAVITKVSNTPVGGNAKDFVFLDLSDVHTIAPLDKGSIKIFFAVPSEVKPGTYTGFMYILDDVPPSTPVVVNFNVEVVRKESYGLSMTINDARSASTLAKPDDPAEFDLAVENLGDFRDVVSIDVVTMPGGWSANLLERDNEIPLPYQLPLGPGIIHPMKLQFRSDNGGERGDVQIMATSLGNKSVSSSVNASVEFGAKVRGYSTKVEVPEHIATNRTYTGSLRISLDVNQEIDVGLIVPPELMVIPLVQAVMVTPDEAGVANFTMMATRPGRYPVLFKLIDSNGIPMPDELAVVTASEPNGTVVLTSDGIRYNTIASLGTVDNSSLPFMAAAGGTLSQKDRESLQAFARVIILGNESIVPMDTERYLAQSVNVTRIDGNSLFDTSLMYISAIATNGTSSIVFAGPKDADFFKAYRESKIRNLPLVICDSGMTDGTKLILRSLTARDIRFIHAVVVGKVGEDIIKSLEEMGISIEKVA